MVPKAVSTSGMMAAAAMGTANTASWAKYLPVTIEGIPTGLVSSSWSVLLRRSSAKLRMVSAGSKNSKALCYGSIKIPVLTNKQCIIEREFEGERVLVAINADDQPFTAHFDAGCGQAEELLTGTIHDFGGGSELKPYSVEFWKMER